MNVFDTLSAGRGQVRRGDVDLVPFLFAVAERGELPGPVLVRLLGDLGLTDPGARTLLARMRTRGALATSRRGRLSLYRLSGATEAAFQRVRWIEPNPANWDGTFHGVLYTVPERSRAFRDALRRAAQLAGYGPLRPGLLVSAHDRWPTIAGALLDPPPGASVYPVRLRLDPDHARAAAAEAWNLEALATTIRERIATARDALLAAPAQPPAAASTLRAYSGILRPVIAALLIEPTLPDELHPPNWPHRDVLDVLQATSRRFQEPARRYAESLLADYGD